MMQPPPWPLALSCNPCTRARDGEGVREEAVETGESKAETQRGEGECQADGPGEGTGRM